MDLQGTPIPSGQRGVKVTTDPASERPIQEPSGAITNDSLAAESVRSGGAYADNRGAQPLGVNSGNTTTNVTDTSAATKLPSASTARDRGDPSGKGRYPETVGGQPDFPGAHIPETGYVGGSTTAKKEMGVNKGPNYPASEKLSQSQSQSQTMSQQPSSGSRAAAAASGSGYQTRSATAGQNKQSGEFFPDDPKYNASFNSEIGSEDDPGRAAELKFQRREAETVAGAAAPAQKGTGNQTWYEPLSSDQRA
ncbi:hypothetical protein BJX61DRAFT_204079 [Aspergillus egyptiacus]|nr:hypothetical protein BJX61DRAFT_204079 [Aspergillus egyptiacus]